MTSKSASGFLILGIALMLLSACGKAENLILFVSDRNGNLEIYTMDPDGNDTTRFTSHLAADSSPNWSPKRDKVAFLQEETDRTVLKIAHSDGTNLITEPSTNGTVWQYRWSPDGDHIAFTSDMDGQPDIFVLKLDGDTNEIIAVTKTKEREDLGSWSSDGEWLSYALFEGESPGVYVRNPNGVDLIRLTSVPARSPVWSPKGDDIAFYLDGEDGNEIHLVNYSTNEETGLVTHVDGTFPVSWSPDGKHIAYVSNQHGNMEIYSMEIDGSDQLRLTRNDRLDNNPVWSPNGKRIAFVSYSESGDEGGEIFAMDADGSKQRRLTNNPNNDSAPFW